MNLGKTFRLFVSSTFSDFSVERRLLQEYVFPEIKKYCNESNLNFQHIDLRWGVSNEAQLDQKTLELCLEEVRASKINPHPNFLIMAGDRYGWIPLPYLIERSEYEAILTNIEKEEDKELLNIWYKLDENQIPASYILCERKNEFVEYLNWEKVENQLRDILQSSVNKTSLSKDDKEKYFMSATEHEVIEGIFKYLNTTPFQEGILQQNKTFLEIDSENVYAYIRNIKSIDESYKNNFMDKDLKNVNKFKIGIKESIENNNILEVDIELENISKDNMNGSLLYSYETIKNDQKSTFVEIMINNLKKSIDSYKNSIEKFSEEELEVFEQKSFKELKMKNFLGREESLQTIDKYLNDNNNEAFVVYGKSGLGKSSLMAKAIDNAQNKYLNKKIVYRFVGSTVNLTTTSEILISILKELGITEEIRKIKNSKTLQEENEKIEEFYYRVYDHLKSIKEDTIIFIDAIDQLINEDEFFWLPKKLPNNLKIVISALKDDNYKEDSKYLEDIKKVTKNNYELQAFDLNNAKELVIKLLEKYNRKISQEQMNYVLDIYKNINSPLYLVVAIQDLKDWKSTDKNKTLAKTQKDEIKSFIDNLSNIHHHNQEFVKRVFAYISLTGGLSENELLELLSSDKEFLKKIAPETFHTNTTKELPIVIWSRLHSQIKEFLKLENVDNQNVMKFFHREFDNVLKLSKDEHEHFIELLQNLMFKYQDEDFYSNRWGKLYLEVLKKYHLEYEFNILTDENSKLSLFSNNLVIEINNCDYLLKIIKYLNNENKLDNQKNINYYRKSLYYISLKGISILDNNITFDFYLISLSTLANSYKNHWYISEAIELEKIAKEYIENLNKFDTNTWEKPYIDILSRLAYTFSLNGSMKESIVLQEEVVKNIEIFYMEDKKEWERTYTNSLLNLAIYISKNIGEIDNALQYLHKAFDIIESGYLKNQDLWIEDYIYILNQLGTLLEKKNELDMNAIKYIEKAYDLISLLYKSEPVKWTKLYLKILINFAYSLNLKGLNTESLRELEKAYGILNLLYNENKNYWCWDYILLLTNLSKELMHNNCVEKSIKIGLESLEILEPLFNKNQEIWTDIFLTNNINIGYSFYINKEIDKAIYYEKKVLEILLEFCKKDKLKWEKFYDQEVDRLIVYSLSTNLEENRKYEIYSKYLHEKF
ncbi:DUF4062 domain-containing protein [Aliarcobacter cryaerophilus]|uniref:ATP-binding protein n=2 Tax=Aliarcobacter cryaerophilus TaxID=28198 RepID=UPI0021B6E0DA|nr:ATP-binding protein [Aliarcobacter cryaerophilus]MCT7535791.1 DUF4062 domain-containing protein [Aliarcobacter cryaerophilus]